MSETPTPDEVYSRQKAKREAKLVEDRARIYEWLLRDLKSGDTLIYGFGSKWADEGLMRPVFDKFKNNGWNVVLMKYEENGHTKYGFQFAPIPGYQFPKKEEKKPWRWWTLW